MSDILYTPEQAHDHYLEARRLNLSGYWLLRDTDRAICVCNGIGASWFPQWARHIIDTVCPHLIVVADIHDVRYDIGGDDAARRRADDEFLANGYAVAEHYYKWYNPARYVAEFVVRRMHRLLRLGGDKAWREAKKK